MARDEHNKAAEHHGMRPNLIAPPPNIMAKATMPRAKSNQPTPSNSLRVPVSIASRPIQKANSRSRLSHNRRTPRFSPGVFIF